MHRKLVALTAIICGFAIAPSINIAPLHAHQQQTNANSVGAMIHLEPDDSPHAGKPSTTWFMLTRPNKDIIAPSKCNCRVVVYNAQKQRIFHHLPLSTMPVEGHQKGHEAIRTTITFPKPGSYTVLLSGESKDGSFNPFKLTFPVTVRP